MQLLSLTMIWKQICGWCLLAIISRSAAISIRDTVTAIIGDPFGLSFGYSGSRLDVTYHYSKDGEPFVPEESRVLQLNGSLLFLEISNGNAGVYQLKVEGSGINDSRTINLLGSYVI